MSLFEEAKDRKLRNLRKTLRHNDDVAVAINKLVYSEGILPPTIKSQFNGLKSFNVQSCGQFHRALNTNFGVWNTDNR